MNLNYVLKHITTQLDNDPTMVPPSTLQAIRSYILEGRPPGGFLRAVLENDLSRAVSFADRENRAALADIISYLQNYCPATAVLRAGAVDNWLELHAKRRSSRG